MPNRKSLPFVASLGLVWLCCGWLGCSSGAYVSDADSRAAQGVLRVLGTEYAEFVTSHGGRPPKDQQELESFVAAHKSRITGLQEVGELFRSPRDKQPLVIYYGDSLPPTDESGFAPIARETVGVDGKMLVANTRGGVQEVSSDQLPPHLDNLN